MIGFELIRTIRCGANSRHTLMRGMGFEPMDPYGSGS